MAILRSSATPTHLATSAHKEVAFARWYARVTMRAETYFDTQLDAQEELR